jgi:hypothetical protein
MSFVIKGGYDAIRKQVMNISLKRAEKWTSGIVMIKKNIFLYNLVPRYDNNIEIVKYNDIHALLLNNAIIYEDKKLFTYKLVFKGLDTTDPNCYDFLDCKYVDYSALKHFSTWRTLN